MNLVIEKSENKVEVEKNKNLKLKGCSKNEDKSFREKYGHVTEGLKKRFQDFWYGWVVVD